jgi:hypothetical protein
VAPDCLGAEIAGPEDDEAGAASGLVNVFQQLGGTRGIAVLVIVSAALVAVALGVVLAVMRPQLAAGRAAVRQAAVAGGE